MSIAINLKQTIIILLNGKEMKLVQFSNGKYGIRDRCFFSSLYLDMHSIQHRWLFKGDKDFIDCYSDTEQDAIDRYDELVQGTFAEQIQEYINTLSEEEQNVTKNVYYLIHKASEYPITGEACLDIVEI